MPAEESLASNAADLRGVLDDIVLCNLLCGLRKVWWQAAKSNGK